MLNTVIDLQTSFKARLADNQGVLQELLLQNTETNSAHMVQNLQRIFLYVLYGVQTEQEVEDFVVDIDVITASKKKIVLLFKERAAVKPSMPVQKYTIAVTDIIYKQFLQYIVVWYEDYLNNLVERIKLQTIQEIHNQLIADMNINYTVTFLQGVGIKDISDNNIVIGLKAEKLQEVYKLMQQNNDAAFVELYTDILKQCIHPVELCHINNAITQAFGIYTKQTIENIIKHVIPHKFNKQHVTGYIQQDGFITVISVDLLDTEPEHIQNSVSCVVVPNIHKTRVEQEQQKDYICYTYKIRPINNNKTVQDVDIQQLVAAYTQ